MTKISPRTILDKQELLLLPLIALWLFSQPGTMIPDSYEVALLADCFWTGQAAGVSCDDVSWNFRPPGGSLLIGPLLPFFTSIDALRVLCAISVLVMFWAILAAGRKLHLQSWCFVGICWLLAAPSYRSLLMVIDARVLVLGVLFAGWAMATTLHSRKQAFLVGLLIGFAALIRPEQQLAIPLCVGFVAWRKGRLALWSFLGAALCVGSWVLSLSLMAGQLVLSPRHWEGWLLQMLENVPLRWAQQIWGMGIWSPPLRAATTQEQAPSIALGVELVGVEEYLSGLTDAVPLWMLCAAAIAVVWGLLQRQTRLVTIPVLLMVLPSVLANVLPQARDPLFPSSNLIPLLIVIGAAPALLLGRAVIIKCGNIIRVGVLGAFVLTAVFVHHETLPSLPDLTRSTAFAELQEILDELPEDSQITATYETAPALFQSSRQWNQWPSPFESRASDWVLVSSLDDKVWEGRIPQQLQPASLWHWVEHGETWFLLYHRKNDSAHPLRPDPCVALEASKQRDDLLRSTLARECLLLHGEEMSDQRWTTIATHACHPILFGTRSPEVCTIHDNQLSALQRRRCKHDPQRCHTVKQTLAVQAKIVNQLSPFILANNEITPIALQLACGDTSISAELAETVSLRSPELAMYLASCADTVTFVRHFNDHFSAGERGANSALLGMMRRGRSAELLSTQELTVMEHNTMLSGVLTRYLLASQRVDLKSTSP